MSRVAGTGRWTTVALVHLIASTVAAASFGAVLGGLGFIMFGAAGQTERTLVGAGFAFLLGLAELGIVSLPRPQRAKQVPEVWRRRFSPEVSAALYGASLGVGVLTPIPFMAFYAVVAWTLFSGDPGSGALVLAGFGFARAAPAAILSPFLQNPKTSYHLAKSLVPFRGQVGQVLGVMLVALSVVMFTEVLR